MTYLKKRQMLAMAKKLYAGEPSGHTFAHAMRVLSYAKKICRTENVNKDVVFVSVLFHDVHRLLSNKTGKYVSPKEAMPEVLRVLAQFEIPQKELEQILFVIENHEDKHIEIGTPTKELLVVMDADALDALGKIGIKRTLAYCKAHNIPTTNLQFSIDAKEYVPDTNPISAVHYICRTIIPNGENMHTKMGQKLAKPKIGVLVRFAKKELKKAGKVATI